MKYLLDTNVWVTYLRGKSPHVLRRFGLYPATDLVVCSVVMGELDYGVERSANPSRSRAKTDAVVKGYRSLPFDDAAARIYARVRADLERRGLPIGLHDYQIAAIALAHGLTLVTHNTGEFSRVPGLVLEDWELP